MEVVCRFIFPPLMIGVGTTETPKAKIYGWAPPPYKRLPFVNPDTGELSYFNTNSHGWKDVEHKLNKAEGIIRILFLGDSNTYGVVPLEDLYTRQVDHLLKKRGYSNVEVITIGVGAWGTDQLLEVLKNEGIEYHPDIIVYQFDQNDVTDNIHPYEDTPSGFIHWKKVFKYELINGSLKRVKLYPQMKSNNKSNFQLFRKIKRLLLKSALIFNINKVKNNIMFYLMDEGNSNVNKKYAWENNPPNPTDPYFLWNAKGGESRALQRAWELTRALVLDMEQIAKKNNAEFVVFPVSNERGARNWEIRWNRIYTDGTSDFLIWGGKKYIIDHNQPLKKLAEILRVNNIPLISNMRQYNRYVFDAHPNKIGNLAMALDVVDFLESWAPFHTILENQ